MKLRILSDIHLEFTKNGIKWINQLIPTTVTNNILILAGDIGNPTSKLYKQFIATIAPLYYKVILISGNHEMYQNTLNHRNGEIKRYGLTMEQIDNTLYELTKNYDNVHYLQKDEVIIDNIRFLGCTLWTDPTSDRSINDYVYIRDFDSTIRKQLYNDHKTWLTNKLSEPTTLRTIVITHHLPSEQLLSVHSKHDCFYYTDLEELINKVDYWICGHSHGFCDVMIGSCRCLKNAVGYPSENLGCNKFFSIDIYD